MKTTKKNLLASVCLIIFFLAGSRCGVPMIFYFAWGIIEILTLGESRLFRRSIMSVSTPKNWWKLQLIVEEKIWIYLVLASVVLVLLLMMPLGHLISRQNVSQESYTTTPEQFQDITDRFIAKYLKKRCQRKTSNRKRHSYSGSTCWKRIFFAGKCLEV